MAEYACDDDDDDGRISSRRRIAVQRSIGQEKLWPSFLVLRRVHGIVIPLFSPPYRPVFSRFLTCTTASFVSVSVFVAVAISVLPVRLIHLTGGG